MATLFSTELTPTNVEKDFIKIQNEWAELIRKRDWVDYKKKMEYYESRPEYINVFNLYKGSFIINMKKRAEDPAFYFYKIDRNSNFYVEGLKQLAIYYEFYYNETEQRQKYLSMINEIENNQLLIPFKYIILFEIYRNDITELINHFDNFQNLYDDIYNFNKHQFEIEALVGEKWPMQDKIPPNLLFEIRAVSFIYLNEIYTKSDDKIKNQIIDNLQLLTKDPLKGFVIQGLKDLNVDLDSKKITF